VVADRFRSASRFTFLLPAVLVLAALPAVSWFFDQVHGSSVAFDYAVDSVASLPARVEGFVENGGELTHLEAEGEPDAWRTEEVVRRHGGGVFPVTVLLVFEDGSEERIAWDGEERWRTFVVEKPVELRHAVVDPERVLLLDVDYTNNSRVREPGVSMVLRQPLRTAGIYLGFGALAVLLMALYLAVAPGVGPASFAGVLLAFVLAQVYLVARLFLRVGLLGGQLELYRQAGIP